MLIDIEHGLAYLRSLPPAEIRPRSKPRKRNLPPAGPVTPEMVAHVVRDIDRQPPTEAAPAAPRPRGHSRKPAQPVEPPVA
jgi:hypothetical protein